MTLMSTEVRRAFYEKVNVLRQAGYEIQYVDMPCTIPVMEVNQMPLGFQCIGDFYADEEVTHVANILAKELSV